MRTSLFVLAVEVSRIGTALGAELYGNSATNFLGWMFMIFAIMDITEFIKKLSK